VVEQQPWWSGRQLDEMTAEPAVTRGKRLADDRSWARKPPRDVAIFAPRQEREPRVRHIRLPGFEQQAAIERSWWEGVVRRDAIGGRSDLIANHAHERVGLAELAEHRVEYEGEVEVEIRHRCLVRCLVSCPDQ
jgi:hypothetical protein